MPFRFKTAKVIKEKFVRKSTGHTKGQNFNFKFRPYLSTSGQKKAEEEGQPFTPAVAHEFRFSDAYMDKYDFQNHSLAVIVDPDEAGVAVSVALAITPEGHDEANTFVRKGDSQKSALFTHHYLMLRMAEAGIITVPEMNIDKTPVDDEDELFSKNQMLDLEYIADVEDIVEGAPGYMEEVEEGEGIALYEIVQGKEIENPEIDLEGSYPAEPNTEED
jgi:hypothetical protein